MLKCHAHCTRVALFLEVFWPRPWFAWCRCSRSLACSNIQKYGSDTFFVLSSYLLYQLGTGGRACVLWNHISTATIDHVSKQQFAAVLSMAPAPSHRWKGLVCWVTKNWCDQSKHSREYLCLRNDSNSITIVKETRELRDKQWNKDLCCFGKGLSPW